MEDDNIHRALAALRELSEAPPAVFHNFLLRCKVLPPGRSNYAEIQETLDLWVSEELVSMWQNTAQLRLFEDVQYGQWGLVIHDAKGAERLTNQMRLDRSRDLKRGDLLFGEFLGDSELLGIRCDPNAADYGNVFVALPLDNREKWPTVGKTIGEFLLTHIRESGYKMWSA